MARKKHSTASTITATTVVAAPEPEPRKEGAPARGPARDLSPEKVERLKSLNHLLLKETVERREEVSQLRSRVDDLAFDHSFLSDAERDVARLVLASYLSDLRALAAASDLSADARARDLESGLASMAAHRNAAEEEARSLQDTANSLSEALKQADEKLILAARDKEEIENRLGSVVSERDSIRKDLDRKATALADLESRVRELEISNWEIEETLGRVRIKNGELSELVKRKEEALQLLIREKNAVEVELEGQRRSVASVEKNMEKRVGEMQIEVESLAAEKKALEARVSALDERYCCVVEKNEELQDEVHALKEAVNSLKEEEAEVRSRLAEMRESHSGLSDEHERLLMEFNCLEKEKEVIQLCSKAEKIEALSEFERLRRTLEEIQEEKVLIDGLRSEREAEVRNLKNELEKLQSDVSDLQEKCRDYGEANDNLRSDKDSIQKALDLEKSVTDELKSQVEELEKIKGDKERELRDAKTNLEVTAEKIEGLSRELALLQLALVEAEKKKGGVWTWLYPVTTTAFAAISFAYATTRGR